MRRLLVAGLLALTACGGSGDGAHDALRDTAAKLDDIRSARMDLSLTARSAAGEPVGFAMSGPFALPDRAGLPVADLRLTELRGSKESTVTFVSTGDVAYVVRDGRARELPGGVSVGGDNAGLGTLRIDGWLRDPKIESQGDTDKITAGLNVAAAFTDLGRLGQQVGTSLLAGLRPLDAEARRALERSAKDSSVEVVTGHEDRLLRRLVITVTLTGEVPPELAEMVPVTLSLSLDLANVNEPVRVKPPV